MKFTCSYLLLAVLATVQAYELRVHFQDGVEVRVTGDLSTPCQDFPPQVRTESSKVNKIVFDKGQFTNEFMIWSGINCAGTLVKRAGAGTHMLDIPSGVGSLKVM